MKMFSPLVTEKGIQAVWLATWDSDFSVAKFIYGAREILEREGYSEFHVDTERPDIMFGASTITLTGKRTVTGREAAKARAREAYHGSQLRVWVGRFRALAKGHRYDWYEPTVGS